MLSANKFNFTSFVFFLNKITKEISHVKHFNLLLIQNVFLKKCIIRFKISFFLIEYKLYCVEPFRSVQIQGRYRLKQIETVNVRPSLVLSTFTGTVNQTKD